MGVKGPDIKRDNFFGAASKTFLHELFSFRPAILHVLNKVPD